ncbi:MAG TPA: homoserine kinase [Gemmatimonadaceae bacterium]|jgi:homoserine kinase|nr:homoserine kinase [Gemmatimonadaceae bacterium]
MHAAYVRVPASTSNLGAGFDCIGLALDRYLTAEFRPGPGTSLTIVRRGTVRVLDDRPAAHDLFVTAFRSTLAARGHRDVGGTLIIDSEIPVARGLGSSAVAVVGGTALGMAAAGDAIDNARILADAERAEGHLDNAAPALLGGLVAVAHGHPFALPLSPNLAFVFAAPGVELATARARAALPATVPHAEATRALSRVAALIRALETGDPELLVLGLDDTLHVPYRLPLIPGGAEVVAAGKKAGAYGVTVSGAGSGLLAITPPARADEVAAAMAAAFRLAAGPEGVMAFEVRPDREGTAIRDP